MQTLAGRALMTEPPDKGNARTVALRFISQECTVLAVLLVPFTKSVQRSLGYKFFGSIRLSQCMICHIPPGRQVPEEGVA